MNVRPDSASFALDSLLLEQENKSLLRFVACGSVDHGKSTLIGRLLYGTNVVLDDQLGALRQDSRKHGSLGEELDFSLLLDGLAAELEQKITIDVAYRYFSTAKRKFIVADTPGHEQYTRNMATGASTADLALILVDAASGLRAQTRRHVLIVSTVGVRHIALVVNKMDKVGWSEEAFRKIEREFREYARELGIEKLVCIPVAARSGDNVVEPSSNMHWYDGPSVLDYLENVELTKPARTGSFRMPVQRVNRPDADFRGYSGTVTSGEVSSGMPVKILPSGQLSRVARIVTYDGDLDVAEAGRSVTLTLHDDIDVSRGDVIAEIQQPPAVTDRISARVVWMATEPLVPGRPYLLKLATSTTLAKPRGGLRVVDLDTRNSSPTAQLSANEIGQAVFDLDRQIAVDAYADNQATGAFILIDRDSYDTVAMGTVERERPTTFFSGLRDILRSRRRVAASVGQIGESHTRSIVKALSWRATGSIDTFILTLLITGSGVWASSIAATEIITKIAAYYLHERVWSIVRWGAGNV